MLVPPEMIERSNVSGPVQVTPDAAAFRLIIVRDVIFCLNLFLVSMLLLTAWLARLPRASTWYGAVSTGVMSAIANLLLLGRQSGIAPSFSLCLTQATLIYSVVVLDSLYNFAFILEAYMSIQYTVRRGLQIPFPYAIMFHVLPYASSAGAFIGIFIYGLGNPATVQVSPTGMYCHLTSSVPRGIVAGVGIISMIMIATLEVLIILTLRSMSGSWKALLKNDAYIAPGSLARIVLFGVTPFLAMVVLCVQYDNVTPMQDASMEILLALIGTLVPIIFGSQKDIQRAWARLFRRRKRPL